MAAQVLINLLRKRKILDKFSVDSAATALQEEGKPMTQLAKERLQAQGIETGTHLSAQLKREDSEKYDWIICMSEENMRTCYEILGDRAVYVTPVDVKKVFARDPASPISLSGLVKPRVCRLMDFTEKHCDIPTPLMSREYAVAFREILLGCTTLVELI